MRAARKYFLRRWLGYLARCLLWLFPKSKLLGRLVDRLTYIRSIYGPFLRNTPGDTTFELCVQGYGRFVADAIERQAQAFTFLDIGANLGLFSLLAARHPCCERVIAVEPLPAIFRNLQANIRRNAAGKVEAVLGAVSATADAFAYLSFNAKHSGMSKMTEAGTGRVRAPVVSAAGLDGLFREPPDRIVVKIDVEGSEIDVLLTLRRTRFYSAIADLIIEVSERNLGRENRDHLRRLLAQDGFEEHSRAGPPEHYDALYRRAALPHGR